MAEKDYYAILGVSKSASADELKSAYKKMAKKWHPDINKAPEATEKFKEVNEAYSVLSDANKRAQYDQFGSESFKSGMGGGAGGFPGGMGGFDFSDMFNGSAGGFPGMEDLLREAFGGQFGGGTRTRRAPQAQHLRYDLELSFEEAAFGATKTISIPHLRACEHCEGTGAEKGSKKEKCPTCKGRGMETRTQRTPFGLFQTTATCSKCGGEGEIIKEPCTRCKGKGTQNKTSSIEIKIPAGIDTGNHLRVPHQGNFTPGGGAQGDLYVVIHVTPHETFKRDGADVYVEQGISFPLAAMGGEVDVPVLGGNVTMTVPAGTQNGKVFRLREKGIKQLNSEEYGDEFVRVRIDVPTHLTSRQKELLEELQAEMHGKDTAAESTSKKSKKGKKGIFGF
jgi:molecular chaperone DnaJ